MVTVITNSPENPDEPEPNPATVEVLGFTVVYAEAGKLTIESELMSLEEAKSVVEGLSPERQLCSVILPVHIELGMRQVYRETIVKLEERAAGIRTKTQSLIRESN